MRVAVINPPVSKVLEAEYDLAEFPRPVLAFLAGYMRKRNLDVELSLVDSKLERIGFEEVVERMKIFKPDIIGLTAFTPEVDDAAKLAGMLKKVLPDAITVIGGVHMTSLPALTMTQFPMFDLGVVGEGEVIFHDLILAIRDGLSLDTVPGIYYRENDYLISTGEAEKIMDLDELGTPAWDLLPPARRYYHVMAERGCPFACPFCLNPNGRKVRARSVKSVLAELQNLVDQGYTYFEFDDDNFGPNRKYVAELLQGIIDSGLNKRISFYVLGHARFLDPESVRMLAEAGCVELGFGMETGVEEMLKAIGKGLTTQNIIDANKECQKAGIGVRGFFIIGHENETWSTAMESVKFAALLNLETPVFGVMVPYPGTQTWELATRGEGGYKRLSCDWKDYNKQVGAAIEMQQLSRRQMELIQFVGYHWVFLRNGRILDWLRFMWRYRTAGFSLVRNMFSARRQKRHIEAFPTPLPVKTCRRQVMSPSTSSLTGAAVEVPRNPSPSKITDFELP